MKTYRLVFTSEHYYAIYEINAKSKKQVRAHMGVLQAGYLRDLSSQEHARGDNYEDYKYTLTRIGELEFDSQGQPLKWYFVGGGPIDKLSEAPSL